MATPRIALICTVVDLLLAPAYSGMSQHHGDDTHADKGFLGHFRETRADEL